MNRASASRRLSSLLIAGVVAVTLAVWAATANPVLTLLPLLLTVLAWALLHAPPHRTALVVFFFAILLDNPKEHSAEGHWVSPIQPLGVLFYENLNTLTGLSWLRFSIADVLLAALVVVAALRRRALGSIPAPRALHLSLAVAWLAIVWLELWGLARGGDFKASLWQIRPLFWGPAIAYVFAAMIRGPRDHAALGKAVVAAAVVKAAMGAYYYYVVCAPLGYQPAYATTHSDTVLFVTAAVIAVTLLVELPALRTVVSSLAILAVAGLGIVVNGRRLAYVSLAASLAAIYATLPPGRLRRTSTRALYLAAPLAALYLAVGWTSGSALFGPARKVASLFSREDRSSLMRDIENYNLILTWKRHLLVGSGFGHPYSELTRPDGIDRIFPLYRYIAHNSVLWFETAGGYLGFTAFWMMLVVAAFFAARGHRFAAAPLDRAAALTSLSVVVIYGVQAYGDMGMAGWSPIFMLAMSLAVASKLAVASGAWPWPESHPAPALAAPLPAAEVASP